MGANVGQRKGALANINITPLVDVVLVLLIIFMLLIREDASYVPNPIPMKADAEENIAIESEQLVLELLNDNSVLLNRNPTTRAEFPEYFRKTMEERTDKKLFVAVQDEVLYKDVVYWMSMAKRNGASLVALQITPPDYSYLETEPSEQDTQEPK